MLPYLVHPVDPRRVTMLELEHDEARRELGRRLEAAIVARGMTRREAAHRLGMFPHQLYRYTDGKVAPSAVALLKIAEYLLLDPRVPFPELFPGITRKKAGKSACVTEPDMV
jgi:transcriptional regulator with XRE-family HTH domain